jgi:hypothetical protein
LQVDICKVEAWIRAGELRAFNVAARQAGRPRYRISPEALEEFELRRQIMPPAVAALRGGRPARRRRVEPREDDVF